MPPDSSNSQRFLYPFTSQIVSLLTNKEENYRSRIIEEYENIIFRARNLVNESTREDRTINEVSPEKNSSRLRQIAIINMIIQILGQDDCITSLQSHFEDLLTVLNQQKNQQGGLFFLASQSALYNSVDDMLEGQIGSTALFWAAGTGSTKIVQWLIDKKVQLLPQATSFESKISALEVADPQVKELIERYAQDLVQYQNHLALIRQYVESLPLKAPNTHAAKPNDTQIIKAFVDFDRTVVPTLVQKDFENCAQEFLSQAAKKGHLEFIQLFLKSHAQALSPKTFSIIAADAAVFGHSQIVYNLLSEEFLTYQQIFEINNRNLQISIFEAFAISSLLTLKYHFLDRYPIELLKQCSLSDQALKQFSLTCLQKINEQECSQIKETIYKSLVKAGRVNVLKDLMQADPHTPVPNILKVQLLKELSSAPLITDQHLQIFDTLVIDLDCKLYKKDLNDARDALNARFDNLERLVHLKNWSQSQMISFQSKDNILQLSQKFSVATSSMIVLTKIQHIFDLLNLLKIQTKLPNPDPLSKYRSF